LLQSHGKIDECIQFAEDVENYETVIVHYINKQEYHRALQKVCEIKEAEERNNVMLRYASVFIKKIPSQTIKALHGFHTIDIAKMVPAFMNIEKGPSLDEALRYIVDFWIKGKRIKSKTVHNLAFYFYSEKEAPDQLLEYLLSEESKKQQG